MTLVRKAKRDVEMGPAALTAAAAAGPGEAGEGWHWCPAVRSFPELSPGLSRDPASLPLCSLRCSWLGSEGCVWAGKAAHDVVAQSLPCPSAGTALLPLHPLYPPPRCTGTPLPQRWPPLPLTTGLDLLVLSMGTFLWCT